MNYRLNSSNNIYGFVGVGNKEPNRDDFTESSPESRPQHEQLLDIEFGHRYTSKTQHIYQFLQHAVYKSIDFN